MKFFFSITDYAVPKQLGFQDPASPLMYGLVNLHHHIMFMLTFILFFVVCLIYFVLESFSVSNTNMIKKYKQIKNLYNVNISHHTLIEIVWTIVPSLLLLGIAIPSFALLYGFETFMDSNISVKVVGHQWYWSYECVVNLQSLPLTTLENLSFRKLRIAFDSYMIPTEELNQNDLRLLEVTNPLVLPVNTYIRVYVTASDVLHSWAIPSLAVKTDAVPGRLNEIMCFINRVGRFYGQCSEICGVNHGFMPIAIYGVNHNDFIIYCSIASKDLLDYLVSNFFIVNNSINSFINFKDTDLLFFDNIAIKKYIVTNFLAQEVTFIKNF
jgi:cytochrome c oxidase subunit 2